MYGIENACFQYTVFTNTVLTLHFFIYSSLSGRHKFTFYNSSEVLEMTIREICHDVCIEG